MKLAVVGSRTFNDYELLKKNLDEIHKETPITLIISGGAKGADSLSEKWADENGIPKQIFKPDWDKFGKRAGFLRNIDIILNSEQVLAMWDEKSKGTQHSINLADHHKIPYKVVSFSPILLDSSKRDEIIGM
jgi:hypothetical protein